MTFQHPLVSRARDSGLANLCPDFVTIVEIPAERSGLGHGQMRSARIRDLSLNPASRPGDY
jgi:hypothetical protein